jgi:hypothetical protein
VSDHVCRSGGALVGPEHIYPQELFDFGWPLADRPIGCNHLRCSACGEEVRSGNRFGPGAKFGERWLEAYRSADWERLVADGVLERRNIYRLYVCACNQHVETEHRFLDEEAEWQVIDPPPPWRCAGHPRFVVPGTLDGIGIAADSDFAALARRAWSHALPEQSFGDLWLSRVYHLMAEDPAGEQLARAVLALTRSSDPALAVEALDFFRQNPTAPGGGELVRLAREERARFAGVANPNAPETDLLYFLLQALACRVDAGDREPLPVLQDELLEPGAKPGFVIDVLKRHDAAWLAAHRTEILSANLQLAHLL